MARVYKRKRTDKHYYLEYRNAYGKTVRESTHYETKAEAEKRLRQALDLQDQLKLQLQTGETPISPVFVRNLLEEYLSEDPAVGEAIHRRSYRDIQQRLNTYALPILGHLMTTEVTKVHINKVLRAAEKAGRSPQTVDHIRNHLSRFFGYAIDKRHCKTNPVAESDKPVVDTPQPKALTKPQVPLVISCIPEGDDRDFCMCAVLSGMRKGEWCGQLWENVDLVGRQIHVNHSYDGPTKGKRRRTLAINDELLEILVRRSQLASRWVFPNPDGSMRTKDYDVAGIFKKALVAAGLIVGHHIECQACKYSSRSSEPVSQPCPNCSAQLQSVPIPMDVAFKNLRSTYGSELLRQTGNIFAVQRDLGHRHIRTTTSHYIAPDHAAQLVDANQIQFFTLNSRTPEEKTMAMNEAPVVQPGAILEETTTRGRGLEPLTSGVTGRREHVASLVPAFTGVDSLEVESPLVRPTLDSVGSAWTELAPKKRTGTLDPAELLTIKEAGRLLNVTHAAIFWHIRQGTLPVIRDGNAPRVRAGDLFVLLERRPPQKAHCAKGHPFDGMNARGRYCKTCNRASSKRIRSKAAS